MVGANEATTSFGRNLREKYLDRGVVAARGAEMRALTCVRRKRGQGE